MPSSLLPLNKIPDLISPGFKADCLACFSTPAGQRVLTLLCKHRSPIEHPYIADERMAVHLHAQQELIALLWLHGTAGKQVQPIITEAPEQPPTTEPPPTPEP